MAVETLTTTPAISNDNVKVRWEEEYLSQGLNKKMVGTIPPGIVRGGVLEAHASINMTVTAKADPVHGDIVASYEDANGNQTTVNMGSGDVDIDLTPKASETVYVAVYVNYNILTDTQVEWRAYNQSELDSAAEKDRLIVFGKVDVPASGLIPAGNVSQEPRRDARWKASSGMMAWVPVVRNGGFEANFAHWTDPSVTGSVAMSIDETTPYLGDRCLRASASGSGSASVDQEIMFPCVEGQMAYLRAMVKGDAWPGGIELQARFYDKDGSYLSSESVAKSSVGTHDWEELAGVVVAPTSAVFVLPRIYASTLSGTGSEYVYLDEVQMFVQVDRAAAQKREDGSMNRSDRLFRLRMGLLNPPATSSPDEFEFGRPASSELSLDWLGAGSASFDIGAGIDVGITGGLDVGGDLSVAGGDLDLSGLTAVMWLSDTDAGTNEKHWRVSNSSGQLEIRSYSDTKAVHSPLLVTSRTGTTIDELKLNATQIMLGGTLAFSTGAKLEMNGDILPHTDDTFDLGSESYVWADIFGSMIEAVHASTPYFKMYEQDAPVDEKRWSMYASAGSFYFRAFDDADSGSNEIFYVTRTGNSPDEFIFYPGVRPITSGNLLGTATYRWSGYFETINLSSAAGDGFASSLVPSINALYDLGNYSYAWEHLHIYDYVYTHGTDPHWYMGHEGATTNGDNIVEFTFDDNKFSIRQNYDTDLSTPYGGGSGSAFIELVGTISGTSYNRVDFPLGNIRLTSLVGPVVQMEDTGPSNDLLFGMDLDAGQLELGFYDQNWANLETGIILDTVWTGTRYYCGDIFLRGYSDNHIIGTGMSLALNNDSGGYLAGWVTVTGTTLTGTVSGTAKIWKIYDGTTAYYVPIYPSYT